MKIKVTSLKIPLKLLMKYTSIFLLVTIALSMVMHDIGSRVAAAPLLDLRMLISVGMREVEVKALMDKHQVITDRYDSGKTIQVSLHTNNFTSPVWGSWFCFFKVRMKAGVIEKVDDVICVD